MRIFILYFLVIMFFAGTLLSGCDNSKNVDNKSPQKVEDSKDDSATLQKEKEDDSKEEAAESKKKKKRKHNHFATDKLRGKNDKPCKVY